MAGWLASLVRVNRPGLDGQVRIAGRAIYVLPTKYGVLFLVLVLALLVGAINYANNPAFLLTFVLTGVGLATLVQTWRTLQGLTVTPAGHTSDFAGGQVQFRYRLSGDRAGDRPALQLQWADRDGEPVVLDLPAHQAPVTSLVRSAGERGRCQAGRMLVSTRYPLGFVKAWCYLDTPTWSPVYPRPAEVAAPRPDDGGQQDAAGIAVGAEDFVGVRNYRPGDSPRRIDWKALAAERGLHTKQFGSGGGEPLWLDWAQWSHLGVEARLSRLCRDVLDAHHAGRPYGLRLPDAQIDPALGEAHRRACLTALALHGLPS